MPYEVVEIRHELCNCEGVNHADPCAACPNGHFGRYEQTGCEDGTQQFGLGDVVAAIATPIARVLGLPCIDPKTKDLRPESGCAKRKKKLNKLRRSHN